MPTIEYWTPDTLQARRAVLLAKAGWTSEELRARDTAGLLDAEMHAVLRELEDLDYLASAV